MDNVKAKIEAAINYWKTFEGEGQKGIAYGLNLVLEWINEPFTEEESIEFILDIQDALYAYMAKYKLRALYKKDLTDAAKYSFNQIEKRLITLPLQSKVEGEQWVGSGDSLPDYSSYVWFYCPKFKAVMDGIFYEEDSFKRSKVFIRADGSHFLLDTVSHWKYNPVPAPPNNN